MKKSDIVLTFIVVLVVVAAVIYFQLQSQTTVVELPPESTVQPVIVEPEEAPIRYPVPQQPVQNPPPDENSVTSQEPQQQEPAEAVEQAAAPIPLPSLEQSDDALRRDLYTLAGRRAMDSLFNMNRIIRRFVVTVDNLPRKHLVRSRYRSNRMVGGRIRVEEDSAGLYLSDANFARYDTFVDLLDSMDSTRLVALYLHYYPLIQAAYNDLGYPSAYFNDRLVEVIDQLLQTPVINGRIRLVRPRVLYRYADPEIEALSAGQKVLIRIGPDNAMRVKAKLRELRKALVPESTDGDGKPPRGTSGG